ncbi:MAG: SDR family oxidoreductase [Clostridia bacterium]|nr:SDR family oxidoreductase [Clostridia bacterium]
MNKSVIVTGGTRGIGAAVTEMFLKDGYCVCAVYNNDDRAAQLLRERLSTDRLIIKKADVSDFGAVETLYDEVYKEFGRLDISVHAAGTELSKMLAVTSPSEWQRVIDVNLTGVFNCSKCAVKKMIVNKFGRIINISSVVADIPNIGQAAYAASKAGVNALTKTLAKETAPFGITVNAISPAFVKTDMFAAYEDKYMDIIPLGRLAEPGEAAALVRFLASDDAAYISGSIYKIAGGV